jgi:hypothetical protein
MTPSAMAGQHPASVGIKANTTNAFEALSAVSLGISTDPQGDTSPTPPVTDTIGIIAPMAYTSLQALLDNSYKALFGTDPTTMTEGSPIRFKNYLTMAVGHPGRPRTSSVAIGPSDPGHTDQKIGHAVIGKRRGISPRGD